MKYTRMHSPIRKSPGYYDCLHEVLKPKPILDTFVAMITKERNDADMVRQGAKAVSEDDDWVIIDKGWER